MNNNTNRSDLFATPTIFVNRYCPVFGRPGFYRVAAVNTELAIAQGVKPGNVHFDAVVDDFGNLVRVSA